nr:MoxR family ATPase [Candidatus Microthrix sp.]
MSINSTLDPLRSELDRLDYLADEGLAMALFLAMRLSQPLLLEGPSGVGKSSAATALAAALRTPLIQLHCYEGSTADDALYRWNRPRQVLALRRAEATNDLPTDQAQDVSPAATPATSLDDLFTADFLIDGPLLRAVRHDDEVPAVLLIDDVDRSDARFEALLVEFLGQMSVTVPEIGTFGPKVPPIVIITCNGSRPLSDALKRGCHYHRMEHQSVERAVEIVRRRVGDAGLPLIEAATAFVFGYGHSTWTTRQGWPSRSTGSQPSPHSASSSSRRTLPALLWARSPRPPRTSRRSALRWTGWPIRPDQRTTAHEIMRPCSATCCC